jgi:AcrR family transcriptional regulator
MTSAPPDPAPSRRERRRREIHERIIEAATELFGRKGFSATTALEISETADVAEKTFYNHFPSKQHLIEELAARSLEHLALLLNEVHQAPGTTLDRLRLFGDRTADFAEASSRDVTREVVLELMRVSNPNGFALEHYRRLLTAVEAILCEGVARGEIAPDADRPRYAEVAVAAFFGMIAHWVTLPDYPLRERLRLLAETVSETLMRRPGPDAGER